MARTFSKVKQEDDAEEHSKVTEVGKEEINDDNTDEVVDDDEEKVLVPDFFLLLLLFDEDAIDDSSLEIYSFIKSVLPSIFTGIVILIGSSLIS